MASSRAEPVATRLTLAAADDLTRAALAAASAAGFAAAVAIVDAGGHLVAFRRDDGAGFLGVAMSQRKAWTAASSGMSTDAWSAIAATRAGEPILHGTGVMAVSGGEALFAGDILVGAIGVAGGSPVQDGEVARAAIRAVAGFGK